MGLGRWCPKCKSSWSVKRWPRLRKCRKCGAVLGDAWRIEVKSHGKRAVRLFWGALGEAREFEARIKQALRLGEPLPGEEEGPSPSLKNFAEEKYFPLIRDNLAESSYKAELSFWRTHILPELGSKRLDEISPLDVERLKKVLKSKKTPRGEPLSPCSIDKALVYLKKALNAAKKLDLLPPGWENPVGKVRRPKYNNRRTRVLSPEEWAILEPVLRKMGSEIYGASLFGLFLGLRRSEILALRWEDVDLRQGVIRLPKEKDLEESRVLPLPEPIRAFLESLPQGNPGERIFKSHHDTITKGFAKAVRKVGLNEGTTDRRNRISFHTLRHTYITCLALEGTPLTQLSKLSRHKSMEMVRRYEHSLAEQLRDKVEAVARRFQVISGGKLEKPREETGIKDTGEINGETISG